MIKVLQVIPSLNRGGLETFVMNVYRSIDRERVQFDFLTNMSKGDYSDEIIKLGGSIHYIPPRNKGMLEYSHNVKNFFFDHVGEYSAIHYHESSLTSLEVLYYAKKTHIPVRIMHSHSSSIMGNKIHYLTHYVGKLSIRTLATHYFGCSDKALDWMYSFTGVRNKAALIQNGIDTSQFSFDRSKREETREKMGIRPNEIVIGHVGRLSRVKNHSFLLKIFLSYLKINSNTKLWIIGSGELEKIIYSQVDSLELSEKVSFLGVRSDTNNLYQAMDIFVMPSLYEGLPVVLVEAQAAGLPVLCSDTISRMSKLTSGYFTRSLSDSPDQWAESIADILATFQRKDCQTDIMDAGFDIIKVSEHLQQIYLRKDNA